MSRVVVARACDESQRSQHRKSTDLRHPLTFTREATELTARASPEAITCVERFAPVGITANW
jgi:hypothetical protein